MRLLPSDPDVETIVSRIKSGDIDLQPDFQRGEVWGKLKKQRLIDSILRDWHVPPIHVIENPKTRKQEVLDGQQRLASIRDFVDGMFTVDGRTEPLDTAIEALDGMRYRDLPEEWKRRFNQFTIRVFRIVDYEAIEPAELFFRLNQPASLTGAEQRNAFFGPVREQTKDLVKLFERGDQPKRFLAFSNSRMAYDDVLSRTALAVERRSLSEKITSADLDALYRNDRPLSTETVGLLKKAIGTLNASMARTEDPVPKFNKATLFSWLIFLVRGALAGSASGFDSSLSRFLTYFGATQSLADLDVEASRRVLAEVAPAGRLFSIYENRSSSRVADVSSVILRDAIIWLVYEDFWTIALSRKDPVLRGIDRLHKVFTQSAKMFEVDSLARRLIELRWGELP
jgi:hypothetical protein